MRAFRFEVRLDKAMETGADWQELAAQYERPPEEWEWYRPVQGPSYALLSHSALFRRAETYRRLLEQANADDDERRRKQKLNTHRQSS